MRQGALVLSLGLVIAVASAATPAAAQVDVDLELVLAVDISRSMDFDEQQFQRQGYVKALQHPEVINAIASGALGRIAITYVEWAGPFHQETVVPWAIVTSLADAEAFAAKIAAAPLQRETGTSISGGLLFAAERFAESGARGMRRTIDVSGDGPNNMGLPVAPMRDRLVEEGITINGLPIMLKTSVFVSPFSIPNLDIYYEDCVIGGPGAFVITVDDMSRFELAVRRKLVLEIAGLPARVIPAAVFQGPPRVDCMIGEKSRGRWFNDNR
jgi:hypothetical protein